MCYWLVFLAVLSQYTIHIQWCQWCSKLSLSINNLLKGHFSGPYLSTQRKSQCLPQFHILWRLTSTQQTVIFLQWQGKIGFAINCPFKKSKGDCVCYSGLAVIKKFCYTAMQGNGGGSWTAIKEWSWHVRGSLQFDESTDAVDEAQLCVFVRMVFDDMSVKEELLTIFPLSFYGIC